MRTTPRIRMRSGAWLVAVLGPLFLSLADVKQTELEAQAEENADSMQSLEGLLQAYADG